MIEIKNNYKYIVITIGLVLIISVGYHMLFGFSFMLNEELDLNEDKFEFESTEIIMDTTEMHLGEVMEHHGRIDGQLVLSDALDHIDSSDSEINSYTWKTDGDEYNSQHLVHFYNNTGSYDVTLMIEYNNGDVIEDTIEINTQGINVTRTGDNTYNFSPPDIKFDNSNVEYEWNLGGSEIKTGKDITHTFDREGIREIDLHIVTNNDSKIVKTKAIDIQ